MKDFEITVEKWLKAGLASAAICGFAFALVSYALGRWHSFLALPIGAIIGATIQHKLGDSTGRWPARTAAVLTLLADFLAKAGGFCLSVSLDFERSQEFENRLASAVFDFTFSDLNSGDLFLFAVSMAIAYVKAFRSNPATTADAPPLAAASAELSGDTPQGVVESGSSGNSAMPVGQENEFSELDLKRVAVMGQLFMARLTMFLVGAFTAYTNADVFINARMGVSKAVHQQLRGIPADAIDQEQLEQLKDEGVRSTRLWAGGFGLVGVAILVAGLLINRFPIAANTAALVLFAGSWATEASQGKPMSSGVIVVKILVIMVLIFALHACIQFKRECMRWIRSDQTPTD